MSNEELLNLAKRARDAAYSPYSGVSVGAALLCADGEVFTGANIENASFSPTVCAERVALFSAIHKKKRDFVAIAIAGGRNGESVCRTFTPCGVCRQVLSEFCGNDLKIIMTDGKDVILRSLGDLLPLGFDGSSL